MDTPRIFVPQPIPEAAHERLEKLGEVEVFPHIDRRIGHDELLDRVRDKHILYALGEIPYDDKVIAAAEDLRLIAAMHVSAKFVDKEAATRRNVPVTGISNTGLLAPTTAEFSVALLMGTAWRLPEADQFTRSGRWQQNQSMALLGRRLSGKTLGLLGFGAVGREIAQRVQGFGMELRYHKRTPLPADEERQFQASYRDLDDLFRESDFLMVTVALTDETRGLVDERLLSLMKPDAILINTSRGPVVDEAALEGALRGGRLGGAGLDVYHREVPEPDPGPRAGLMELPNVVLTPHIGSAARETREQMAHQAVDAIEAFLRGEQPPIVLNPEVYGQASA